MNLFFEKHHYHHNRSGELRSITWLVDSRAESRKKRGVEQEPAEEVENEARNKLEVIHREQNLDDFAKFAVAGESGQSCGIVGRGNR